jgi:hypothetical protein
MRIRPKQHGSFTGGTLYCGPDSHLHAGLLMADILYLGVTLIVFALLALCVAFAERL